MEEGYLALRWNNHNTVFTKVLNLLREQETYTDVSLACGGHFYPAHKFVLSTCSDYFKEMFLKTSCKHPVVFMKDVSGKDLESLLDFMYKGEVRVPQSQLGSLLRTAEGLQVKGLAVPDDAPRATSAVKSSSTVPYGSNATIHKASSSGLGAASSLPARRKRAVESNRLEGPPRLKPLPRVRPAKAGITRPSRLRSHAITMPELKRIKLEEELGLPVQKANNQQHPPTLTCIKDEVPSSPSPEPSKHHNGVQVPAGNKDVQDENCAVLGKSDSEVNVKYESIDELPSVKAEDNNGDDIVNGNSEDNNSGEEEDESNEEEEEEEEDEENNCDEGALEDLSRDGHSEVDDTYEQSNSSLPNSDISTAEMLQVDLSEDGTQFIIGPGGRQDNASRSSSAAGEDDTSSGRKKPFTCPLCRHTFTRRDNLANHLKTHTGDRPFMCPCCHKCFSRKDYLKQHERIHTGEKPYACDICGRAFTRKEGLTDHMRCHYDLKAFACDTCGKSFKQKCGLRFHKRNYKH